MIIRANAKINLGLHITAKRPDGYHDLETVFYPVGWTDLLELLPDAEGGPGVRLSTSGIAIPGEASENICVKAYELIARDYPLPGVQLHLHKRIPTGAGLGGGSSDAAFFIRALNELLDLGLAWGELHHYARQLGADCSFFITNRPVIAEGKGDQYERIALDLSAYHIAIIHPGVHVSTAEAYRGVTPAIPAQPLEQLITDTPVEQWKDVIVNDFEKTVFAAHPVIAELKQEMYDRGAVYAAMSGSGSAVFGIFRESIDLGSVKTYASWQGPLTP